MGNGVFKLSNEKLIEEYVTNGLGVWSIHNKYKLDLSGLYRRINRLAKKGLIPEGLILSRTNQLKVDDKTYMIEYPALGEQAIAKKYGLATSTVQRHLRRLGILDSSRQNKKKEGPRRSRRPRKNEFLEETKRDRFQQESGCCQICHQLIGDGTNYRIALYHHIKLASSRDGNREPENCMVLHPECHQEHFRELHGYDWNKLVMGYTK